MIYYWRVYKKYIILVLSVMLIICGIIYKNTVYDAQVVLVQENVETNEKKEEPVKEETTVELITVYVCGSVTTASNVTLPIGSRVEDAIRLAGGITEKADINAINMAQKLTDADMIYVPEKGEVIGSGSKGTAISATISSAGLKSTKTIGKININKATAAELDELPGIGPSTADKIIEYRTSKGGFKSIEEINDVSGIGDSKYNEIKNLITVN